MGYALLPQAVVASQQHRFGVHWCPLPPHLQPNIARVDTCFVTGAQSGWSPALRALAQLLGVVSDVQQKESALREAAEFLT
jgi:hypothetical protein